MKSSALFVCLALASLVGCSSSSSNDGGNASDSGAPTDAGSTSDDDAGAVAHGNHDAGSDASVAVGAPSAGIEGKSCADACKALTKKCTPTCSFNDSIHGGTQGPLAGAGFYSSTTSDSSGSFTVNAMRFEASCDTVFSSTWTDNPDDPGEAYEVDYTYTGTPISCCCE